MNEKEPQSTSGTFSLRTLLAATLMIALAFVAWNASRRLDEAQRDLSMLREELGHLVGRLHIEDESKFHAVEVDAEEPNTWRWRLFVPQGERYRWCLAHRDVPREGCPEQADWGGVSNEPYQETGNEVLVTARLRDAGDGSWRLSVESLIAGDRPQMGGATMVIPAEDLEWMFTIPSTEHFVLGSRETKVFEPQGDVLLLHRRARERLPDGSFQSNSGPMPGFALWLRPW